MYEKAYVSAQESYLNMSVKHIQICFATENHMCPYGKTYLDMFPYGKAYPNASSTIFDDLQLIQEVLSFPNGNSKT
jgi:hypothetical protein